MKKKIVMNTVTKQITTQQAYDDFIKSRIIRNVTERTIAYYKENIGYLLRFKKLPNITDYSRTIIDDYIVNMKENGLKDTTINTRIRGIRAWFVWVEEFYEVKLPQIKPIKQDKVIKQCYTIEEIEKLLENPNKLKFDRYRDWVMINFLLCTGSRLSSIVNVHVCDVDFITHTILFRHSKNRTQYVIPMAKQLEVVLKEYVSVLPLDIQYLFPTQFGTQLSTIGCQQAIRRYCKERGVEKTSIHLFRHTFATNYCKFNKNPYCLQQLLNHSSIEVSRKYVHLSVDDLTDSMNESCILNRVNTVKKE